MCFPPSILLKAILLPLAALALLSCNRPAAEEYSEKTSLSLSEISQRLLEQDLSGAQECLQEHERLRETLLSELLSDAEQEQDLLRQAHDCLQKEQFHSLSALLHRAEKDGQATPELLRYRSIPQALQALQLFCQRMPWESAEDLQNALDWLQPYTPALEQSPAFQRFWGQQQNLLQPLRQRDLQRQSEKICAEMDAALWQGHFPNAWAAGNRLRALNPDHPLFEFLDWSAKSLRPALPPLPPASAALQEACELAFALCWEQLSASQQKRLLLPLATLPPESFHTLSGLSLLARHHASPEWLALSFQRWQAQARAHDPLPLFFRDYLFSILPRPEQVAASCRLHPCPGFTDFFSSLNDLLSPTNLSNQRK